MKKIKLTADFTTTISREVEVEDDFNPFSVDLDDLWYANGGYSLKEDEKDYALMNYELDEVWQVKDENDNEIYVK